MDSIVVDMDLARADCFFAVAGDLRRVPGVSGESVSRVFVAVAGSVCPGKDRIRDGAPERGNVISRSLGLREKEI